MNRKAISIILSGGLALAGCAQTTPPRYGTTSYGDTGYRSSGYSGSYYDEAREPVSYTGYVTNVETIEVQPGYKFGVGSVIGAVAGGLLGHQIGRGSGNTAATIAGAAVGGAAGTAIESNQNRQVAQRVTVDLREGGQVTIVQPPDPRVQPGSRVAIMGTGEAARVVPG